MMLTIYQKYQTLDFFLQNVSARLLRHHDYMVINFRCKSNFHIVDMFSVCIFINTSASHSSISSY